MTVLAGWDLWCCGGEDGLPRGSHDRFEGLGHLPGRQRVCKAMASFGNL